MFGGADLVNDLFGLNFDLVFRQFCFEKVEKSSVDEKLQLVYDFLKKKSSFPFMLRQSSKSAAKSKDLRNVGNGAFARRDYAEALKHYTRSVAFAPAGSPELALGYANRSAVAFQLSQYESCVADINRALRENCPESSKPKLLDRKKRCLAEIQSVFNSLKVVPGTGLQRSAVEKHIAEFDPDGVEFSDFDFQVPQTIFKNKMIPNASEKIRINVTSENKIRVMAAANIKPGEFLAIEEPFAWNFIDRHYSHCANCFVRNIALIHCPSCSMVMFCSIRCRDSAFESFHRLECQIFSMLPSNYGNTYSFPTWTALRTLLRASKHGRELDKLMNHAVFKRPLSQIPHRNGKENFISNNCSAIFNHGRRSDGNKFTNFSTEISVPLFAFAAHCLYLLRHTTFFGQQDKNRVLNLDVPLNDRELYVGGFLLRCLQNHLLPLKETISLSSSLGKPNEPNNIEVVPIGVGIFPLMNLFGHSCDPHVNFYSYNNKLACRAIRPIKEGEQIFVCYDFPYQYSSKSMRIFSLKSRYNFDCTCEPCQCNWPCFEEMSSDFPKVVSDAIGTKKFQEYFTKFQLFRAGQLPSDFPLLEFMSEYMMILDKRFKRPFREFSDCSKVLEFIFSMNANHYTSKLENIHLKL